MLCQNCRSAIATARYHYGIGSLRRITALCGTCSEKLAGMGMDLRVERRMAATDTRPVWLRNASAKVLDHGSIA
jgi:hypothetical protein